MKLEEQYDKYYPYRIGLNRLFVSKTKLDFFFGHFSLEKICAHIIWLYVKKSNSQNREIPVLVCKKTNMLETLDV